MYMDKQVKRGYNEYIRLDEGIGKDAMMDVAFSSLWRMATPGAARSLKRKLQHWYSTASAPSSGRMSPTTLTVRTRSTIIRPACTFARGVKFEIIAHGPCNIYIQKTLERKDLPEQDVQAGRHRYLGTRQQGRADGLHQARRSHLLRP